MCLHSLLLCKTQMCVIKHRGANSGTELFFMKYTRITTAMCTADVKNIIDIWASLHDMLLYEHARKSQSYHKQGQPTETQATLHQTRCSQGHSGVFLGSSVSSSLRLEHAQINSPSLSLLFFLLYLSLFFSTYPFTTRLLICMSILHAFSYLSIL